jgi:predicted O-methyltransferase YrrM
MLSHAGLTDRVRVLRGSLDEVLQTLLNVPSFDVVFIDHDKRHYVPVSQGVFLLLYA